MRAFVAFILLGLLADAVDRSEQAECRARAQACWKGDR
jgi:hypothetical protein